MHGSENLKKLYISMENENDIIRQLFLALVGENRDGVIQNIKKNFDNDAELYQEINNLETEIQYLYNYLMNNINNSMEVVYRYIISINENMEALNNDVKQIGRELSDSLNNINKI